MELSDLISEEQLVLVLRLCLTRLCTNPQTPPYTDFNSHTHYQLYLFIRGGNIFVIHEALDVHRYVICVSAH